MPPRRDSALREAIVAAARTMHALGLSPGRSGNISVRRKDGMLITASGIRPEDMDPETDVVFIDRTGAWAAGATVPSSEWPFHRAIYAARPDAASVVHCHSRFATALACAHLPIPAFHYMVAKAGGAEIPLAPYATYGTPELTGHAAAALQSYNACLLANHGQVAIGPSLDDALELAGVFRNALGEVFIDYFLKLKRNETGRFLRWLEEQGMPDAGEETTVWEQNEYFDFF